jgi:hypothetical protein
MASTRGSVYSIFGIAVDRKYALKGLFSQEKTTFRGSQKVFMYSEDALNPAGVISGMQRTQRIKE